MITLFRNNASDRYFLVDPKKSTMQALAQSESDVFFRYSDFLEVTTFTLPDYATVKKFQKLIKTGVLEGVPYDKVPEVLSTEHPEYFI